MPVFAITLNFFLLTSIAVVFEFGVYFLFVKSIGKRRLFLSSIAVNFMTFPFAVFSIDLLNLNYFLIEILVIAVESLLLIQLIKVTPQKAVLVSLITNLTTILVAYVLKAVV